METGTTRATTAAGNKKNKKEDSGISIFVSQTHNAIFNDNGTWVGKANSLSRATAEELKKLDARLVSVTRQNVLDRLVCQVRDCFPEGKKVGYSVYEDGERASECFARRKSGNVTKAYLNAATVVGALRTAETKRKGQTQVLRDLGFSDFKSVTYEKLMAFEYGEFGKSAGEWTELFSSLGYNFPNSRSVAESLNRTTFAGSRRKQVSLLAKYIYNWDEIRNEIYASCDQSIINLLGLERTEHAHFYRQFGC